MKQLKEKQKLKETPFGITKVMTREGIKECYDIRPRIFNTWLINDFDIPSTRAQKLGVAIDALHDALCYMDEEYQEKIFNMPIKDLVNQFAKLEELRTL